MVALIRVYPTLVRTRLRSLMFFLHSGIEQNKSQQCGPQPSNSTENPSKILPKPSPNPPSEKHVSKALAKIHLLSILDNFWWFFGQPRASTLKFPGILKRPSGSGPPQKSTFWDVCFQVFSKSILLRFCVVFCKLETLKIAISPWRGHDFHKIAVAAK